MKYTYFALLGTQRQLAYEELEAYVGKPAHQEGQVVFFADKRSKNRLYKRLHRLSGTVKRGRVFPLDQLPVLIEDEKLLGTNDQHMARRCKEEFGLKRYKLVDMLHTDREIQKKGIELLGLGDDRLGRVEWRQDISWYEAIDFEKPVRGMQVGMMPAKLTQLMINLGVAAIGHPDEATIYDPFCGFGTTLFAANSMGYNAIGSDKNITPTKQNIKRRESHQYATSKKLTIFKHNATSEFTKPFLKHVDVIVSEGRLGPVVSNRTHINELQEHLDDIFDLYTNFFVALKRSKLTVPVVIAIPSYRELSNPPFEDFLAQIAAEAEGKCTYVGTYQRDNQVVKRNIVIFSP